MLVRVWQQLFRCFLSFATGFYSGVPESGLGSRVLQPLNWDQFSTSLCT